MNRISAKNYKQMSEEAGERLVAHLKRKPDTMFCIATGHSPTGTYEEFIKQIGLQKLDTSKMKILKLDEWFGLPKDHPSTCEYYIQKTILEPLGISKERYISFDPMEEDAVYECERISNLIIENGGIDCCVLGLGKNGHLGLNEPQETLPLSVHKVQLDSKTQTHAMLLENQAKVSMGYTLGIKDILDAKEIVFLVTGEGKQKAYQDFNQLWIGSKYPANYLWLHQNTTCIVDKDTVC